LLVYAADASGTDQQIQVVYGADTGLNAPDGITLNASGSTIYVVNTHPSVTAYPSTANGNVAPIQKIAGPNTGMAKNSPYGVALDATGNIYVVNHTGSVTVYAAGAHGSVAPIRTISGSNTGLASPAGIAIH